MNSTYKAKLPASVAELKAMAGLRNPLVILVEGTRQLPEADRPNLVALGRLLATEIPGALFRTGNATGADTAFAAGVASVDAKRLQYVLPNAGMGRSRRQSGASVVPLEAVPAAVKLDLADATTLGSPATQRLVDFYLRETSGSALGAKGAYLMRDTLKVMGCAKLNLAPATVGIFYMNDADPMGGGTGHTIRICIQQGVPVVTQKHWKLWL